MKNIAIILSTGFGIGYAPGAPGTFASLAALPLGYLILFYGSAQVLFILALCISVLGIWASGAHAEAIGKKDPGSSVIDEIAGQLLAMLPIVPMGNSSDAIPAVCAFFLFRFFDILKPWPICRLERLPGGVGIMADDIAAGLISAALLYWAVASGWI